jgi:hypothetical protein
LYLSPSSFSSQKPSLIPLLPANTLPLHSITDCQCPLHSLRLENVLKTKGFSCLCSFRHRASSTNKAMRARKKSKPKAASENKQLIFRSGKVLRAIFIGRCECSGSKLFTACELLLLCLWRCLVVSRHPRRQLSAISHKASHECSPIVLLLSQSRRSSISKVEFRVISPQTDGDLLAD